MSLTVEKCIEGWTNSLAQLKIKVDIVFFGDSLTYYGDFSSSFPGKVVCNLGLRGDTIQGMIDRVAQVKVLLPDRVFLMAGINDIATNDLDTFKKQYDRLIRVILQQVRDSELIVQSLLPVNDKAFKISCDNRQIIFCNEIIKSLSEEYNLCFLDLFSLFEKDCSLPEESTKDGIHLSATAYDIWLGHLFTLYNN